MVTAGRGRWTWFKTRKEWEEEPSSQPQNDPLHGCMANSIGFPHPKSDLKQVRKTFYSRKSKGSLHLA